MSIFMLGINYRQTHLALREKLHLNDEALQALLGELKAQGWAECAILSTCNRLEVYGVVSDPENAASYLQNYLESQAGQALQSYSHRDLSALHHLMRVAAGLDSVVFGEAQILGQVVKALESAQSSAGPILNRFFQQAINTGKKARSQTQISCYSISLGQIAVRLAQQHGDDLSQKTVIILGAGEIGEHVIKAFRHSHAGRLICLNRSDSKAEDLAKRISGEAMPWANLPEALALGDIIITATSAPQAFIFPKDLPKPTLLIDLSLPRNIAPQVAEHHLLYTLDDLRFTAAKNLNRREEAVQVIEKLMHGDALAFWEWYRAREVVPVIADLHRQAKAIIAAELDRLGGLSAQESEAMQLFAHRITQKLLHEPTLYLKQQADNEQAVGILTQAFKLLTPSD